MPRSELCKLFQSYLTSSIAKDTLIKEIVNDELIVSVIDIKATSHDILFRTKLSLLLPKLMKYMKYEVITVHLVKIIVPFLFGAPRCPR